MYDCWNEAIHYLIEKYGSVRIKKTEWKHGKKVESYRDVFDHRTPVNDEDKVIVLLMEQYNYGIESKKELYLKLLDMGVIKMNVEVYQNDYAKLNVRQLEEVIEMTFGFHYDFYENENTEDHPEVQYNVTDHASAIRDEDYDQARLDIVGGECPEPNSLLVILNELCERGQIESGTYFI